MMKRHLHLQFLKINKFVIVLKRWQCFQFTQEIKDISFVEAVKELGDRVNVVVDIEATQSTQMFKLLLMIYK